MGGLEIGGVSLGGLVAGGLPTVGLLAGDVLTEGVVTEGVVTEGIVIGGTVTDGVVTDGIVIDGTVTDGIVTEGVPIEGNNRRPVAGGAAKSESKTADPNAPARSERHATRTKPHPAGMRPKPFAAIRSVGSDSRFRRVPLQEQPGQLAIGSVAGARLLVLTGCQAAMSVGGSADWLRRSGRVDGRGAPTAIVALSTALHERGLSFRS